MKKTVWILLSLMSIPLYAQSLMDTMSKYQQTIEPEDSTGGTSVKKPVESVQTKSVASSVVDTKCEEVDQTSLPLTYLSKFIQSPDGKLEINHDPRKGTLDISAPKMIGNCNSMLEWKIKDQVIDGEKIYSVEAKIKDGDNCVDGACDYSFELVDNGVVQAKPIKKFKPTVAGFEECLKSAGVIEGGGVKKAAIYTTPLSAKFTDIYDTGKLLFVSHGPNTTMVGAKYAKNRIHKCDYYEDISADKNLQSIVSLEDLERTRLDAEATKLKACSINEYSKVADFIEKYESYASQLEKVRDNLIQQAAINAAKNFDKNQFSEEDLKVMADFERYIVQPKIANVKRLYQELLNLQGSEADAKKAELAAAMKDLKKYNAKPYFEAAHTEKMLDKGRFDEADKLNTMKLTISAYASLGSNNGKMTPEAAIIKVNSERRTFLNYVEGAREKYALKTGELTGKEDYYRALARGMRSNIQTRTANYTSEIQEEYARTQQGGYCYAYFRNTQKCIQDSLERIQEIQNILKHHNQIDEERAKEYDEKAVAYGKLEAEGRRYIAAQNGEEAPPEKAPETVKPVDTMLPPKRDSGAYSFNYPGQGQMPQQQSPMNQNPLAGWQAGGYQQQQQQYNPFQMMGQMGFGQQQGYTGYQQPFMGQQAYNGYGGYGGYGGQNYNFMYGGGGGLGVQNSAYGGYGQPVMGGYGQQGYGMQGYGQQGYGLQGQQGFWGQPYGAYSMNSMYGGYGR